METLPDIGVNPSYGLRSAGTFARDVNQFGDGYELRRPAGLNSHRRTWDITWKLLTEQQMQVIRDFLNNQLGVHAFTWVMPGGGSVTVICEEPPVDSHDNWDSFTLSATFKEDHNL